VSLSLYRKYRPETFTDVTGQEHVETTLKNAVQSGSVSHAYLFCGPRGTGKTTTARLLAKALLCEKAPTDHPDGTCAACREIADGLHPDVYELDAASRTGVENVREEIIGRVQFAPTRGAWKIYIIDEVHMLSTAAFNALLKTLEEPPSHVLFVLCTTDPHKVPETIQSRCQRFDFHRLSEQQISERLAYISEQEGFTTQPEALALIAQRSQGGMRDAISSLEQIAVFGGGTVSFEAAESMLGEVSLEQLFSVARLIAARDVAGCFAWVASFTQNGTDIAQFVRDLSVHTRNLYVASVLGADAALTELLDADDEQTARYREQATLFGSPDRLANLLVVLGDLSVQMRSAANARLALEIALTRMARPDSDLTLESLAARIAVLETVRELSSPSFCAERSAVAESICADNARVDIATPGIVAPSAQHDESSSADPSVSPELTSDAARRLWLRVEKELGKAKKHSVAMSLGGSSARPDPRTGGLLVELPNNASFAKQNLERHENRELLRAFIERLHGTTLPLTFTLGPAREPAPVPRTELFESPEQTSAPVFDAPTPEPPPADVPPDEPPPDVPPAAAPTEPSVGGMLGASFGVPVTLREIDP
jgi:DNA polymerase-3 subunit gamma/tau